MSIRSLKTRAYMIYFQLMKNVASQMLAFPKSLESSYLLSIQDLNVQRLISKYTTIKWLKLSWRETFYPSFFMKRLVELVFSWYMGLNGSKMEKGEYLAIACFKIFFDLTWWWFQPGMTFKEWGWEVMS